MEKSKIFVAQFYTENVLYGKFSEAINRSYCKKHGYTYVVETDTNKIRNGCEGRSYTWYKPKLINEILNESNPEYIIFLDADAIFVDHSQTIESFINEKYDIIFAEDIGGVGSHSAMNAGAFIIKNTPNVTEFLEKWWSLGDTLMGKDGRDLSVNEDNLDKVGYFREGLWHDQTCVTYLYEHDDTIKESLKVISNRSFNHYDYNKNGFIFHAFRHGDLPFRTLDIRYRELIPKEERLPEINLIVYHIFAKNDFKDVIQSQVDRLKSSGVYDWCDKMEVTFTGRESELKTIQPIFDGLEKVNITITSKNHYEYYAIHTIWEYSQKYDGKVFYLHTKGVSNKYKDLQSKEICERKVEGIKWWRETLEYFLIDKWRECVEKLNDNNQCGLTNVGGWWWGNFWWSNLSWVGCNSEPEKGDRWYFEAWLNKFREPKKYEWFHFTFNPYYSKLPYDIYNTEKYKSSNIEFIKAEYGTLGIQTDEGCGITERLMVDVSKPVLTNFENNNKRGFNIYSNNNLAGDPNHGFKKHLEITFKIDGEECILVIDEGIQTNFKL